MKRLLLPTLALCLLAACNPAPSPSPSNPDEPVPSVEATSAPTPDAAVSPTPEPSVAPLDDVVPADDLLTVAANAGSFTTFLGVVEVAGLAADLRGPGPFTLFVPTDEAFSKMDPATRDALLADPAALRKAILYHAVAGALTGEDLAASATLTSVAGGTIAVSTTDGAVRLNGSVAVALPEIAAGNGSIFAIGTVLTPPAK